MLTHGNFSYVDLYRLTHAAGIDDVLKGLSEFETENPKLRILNWQVDKSDVGHHGAAEIVGIYIQHEPKS